MLIGIDKNKQGYTEIVMTAESIEEYQHLEQLESHAQDNDHGIAAAFLDPKLRNLTLGINCFQATEAARYAG